MELYLLFIFSITILPIRIINDSIQYKFHILDSIQLIPFRTIINVFHNSTAVFPQIAGNIILLFPLPILLGFSRKVKKTNSIILISIFFSFSIELMQLFINVITHFGSRTVDIDDIILNSIGILAGTVVFHLIKKILPFYNWINETIVLKSDHD